MFPEHISRGKKTNKHFEIKSLVVILQAFAPAVISILGCSFTVTKRSWIKLVGCGFSVVVVRCNKFGLNCCNKKLKTKQDLQCSEREACFEVISAAGQRHCCIGGLQLLALQQYSAVIVKQKCPKNVNIAKIARDLSLPKMVQTFLLIHDS